MVIGLLAMTSGAFACGGMFCDARPAPIPLRVDQTAERIVFAVEDGMVETHVQVSYEGRASDFAWVVPVPGQPEITTTTEALFDAVEAATLPSWSTTVEVRGTCKTVNVRPGDGEIPEDCVGEACNENPDLATDSSDQPAVPVTVLSSETVGPYETVVLQATDAAELVIWLQDNDFSVPDSALPRIEPYIDGSSTFVALRLAKNRDTGDLVPLAFRYASDTPVIPLQLTGVAADPDMRLKVWVLGEHRAVPSNYLHVRLNPFAINWRAQGANYDELISRAADEAGGQAFVTDGVVETSEIPPLVPEVVDLSELARTLGPARTMRAMVAAGVPINTDTAPILARHVDVPDGVLAVGFDDLGWWTCLSQLECSSDWPGLRNQMEPIDAARLAEDLQREWVDVITANEDLLRRHRLVTGLCSSMGPDEMTVDPMFTLNPDLPLIDPDRRATFVVECGPRLHLSQDAPAFLELEDGRRLRVASGSLLPTLISEFAAEVIESTSSSGEPTVITSNTAEIDRRVRQISREIGCGCQAAGGVPGAWMMLLAFAWRRRRSSV